MKVWIDAMTGTWGDIDDLYIVDISESQAEAWQESSNDSVLCEYAKGHGLPITTFIMGPK